jgi:hypothetical protein
MFQCLPSKAVVYLMHHAIHYIERMFVFRPHRLDARFANSRVSLNEQTKRWQTCSSKEITYGETHVSIVVGFVWKFCVSSVSLFPKLWRVLGWGLWRREVCWFSVEGSIRSTSTDTSCAKSKMCSFLRVGPQFISLCRAVLFAAITRPNRIRQFHVSNT